MKKIILFLLVLALAAAMAFTKPIAVDTNGAYQAEQKQTLPPFQTLQVDGPAQVVLIQTSTDVYELTLSGPESLMRLADISVQDDTLHIRYKQPVTVKGDNHLRLSVLAPAVQQISTRGQAEVVVPGTLITNALTLQVADNSEVEISSLQVETLQTEITGNAEVEIEKLSCQLLQIKTRGKGSFESDQTTCPTVLIEADNRSDVSVTGLTADNITAQSARAAEVKIKGVAASASLIARGRSGIHAGSLRVDKADVMAENSAHIDVRVQDSLNAQTQGRGEVEYRGWPKSITRIGKESSIYPIR